MRNQRFCAFGITAREIDAADGSVSRMWTERRAGIIELGIENVFAMTARAHAVVDDER